jgi:hypothetical protein
MFDPLKLLLLGAARSLTKGKLHHLVNFLKKLLEHFKNLNSTKGTIALPPEILIVVTHKNKI